MVLWGVPGVGKSTFARWLKSNKGYEHVDTDVVVPNDEFDEHVWVASTAGIEAPENVHQLARLALGHTPAALVAVARSWLAAWSAHDLEALLALYADDAVHTSPKLRAREPAVIVKLVQKVSVRYCNLLYKDLSRICPSW